MFLYWGNINFCRLSTWWLFGQRIQTQIQMLSSNTLPEFPTTYGWQRMEWKCRFVTTPNDFGSTQLSPPNSPSIMLTCCCNCRVLGVNYGTLLFAFKPSWKVVWLKNTGLLSRKVTTTSNYHKFLTYTLPKPLPLPCSISSLSLQPLSYQI